MRKIKVLIVDDSAFMRKLISDFVTEDSMIEVVGVAKNGKDGIDSIKKWKPDVVTLDVEMPIMNGLDALKIIMDECPVPVIMLSSTTVEGAENTLLSMQYGAFDFIQKPSGLISLDLHKIKQELIEKIHAASNTNIALLQKTTKVHNHLRLKKEECSNVELCKKKPDKTPFLSGNKRIIAIGTSTGGPRALQCVLTYMPENIDAPILIVQHMPPGFTKSLANRLNGLSRITVKEAENGENVQNGVAYIAPGGFHLTTVQKGNRLKIQLNKNPLVNGHRPSVDVMFESISNLDDYSVIAVIMTGMGNDGSKGLISLKKKSNVVCIAESEQSSIVFGMPKAAIATNFVDVVEDIENIAQSIIKYC